MIPFFRVPVYPCAASSTLTVDDLLPFPVPPLSVPPHLLPVFLLVLALHTCLPLPSAAALLLAAANSAAHLAALAAVLAGSAGGGVAGQGGQVFKTVRAMNE